jgi:uncharacterized membrane protein
MMEEMEALYTLRFSVYICSCMCFISLNISFLPSIARNDRKRAAHRLKGGSVVKSHHYSSFRSGIFFGLALPPLISGLWSSASFLFPDWFVCCAYLLGPSTGYQHTTREELDGWEALLYIYAILAIPVIFATMVGINLMVWARARINYGFIFGELPIAIPTPARYADPCSRTR